uniref:Secreted protein n=1 Tax=Colobus angolensis palliatus TaxID=336983 RepID=A0A2K5H7A2_COLAP
MCVHRCECVCMRACLCVDVCMCVASCLGLPMNVVECYTWRVLVFHQFQDEEPHDAVDLETVPLERQPRDVQHPGSIRVFCSRHTNLNKNSTALDRGIFTLMVK